MKDLDLNKGLQNPEALRRKLVAITDRFAGVEARSLNVHVDFPCFRRSRCRLRSARPGSPGIKIHATRMMRLMEVLLYGGTHLSGCSATMHQAILASFHLSAEAYTLNQLRYDLPKIKAHGLLQRHGGRISTA